VGQPLEVCLGASARGLGQPRPRRLPPSDCWLTGQELVDRLAAGKCADGVTLVNDRIQEFDDGRVTYLGHAEDEVHVAVQWGNPLPTLVRLGAALLSKRAFNQILTPSRIDPLLSAPTSLHTLRLGRQLGWLSDSTQDHSDLRTRYKRVTTSLLHRLGGRNQSRKTWSQLCSEAHGLLATATNLYDAAGLDVTIHVRLPDTAQLTRDKARYRRFISFMKNTVPKHAAYRGNSAPRMLLEKDGEKLGYRLPVDIDNGARDATLTADWVIIGPDVASFRTDLLEAFESVSVREQIASGAEIGIRIPIEVGIGNERAHLQETISTLLDRRGTTLAGSLDISTATDLYLYAFGDIEHESLTCSPFDIAEGLIAADRFTSSNVPLTVSVLARGLGVVSSKKLYPWLPPTARKLMRSLYKADRPLKRSEILESADISKNSYGRHRSTLEDSGLLVEPETHRYTAVIPGEWSSHRRSAIEEIDEDAQKWVLYQKLLAAQIRARRVASVQNASSIKTRTYIG